VDAWNVWNAPQLRYTPVYLNISGPTVAGYLDKYVLLYMGDIDHDDKGDGDQALTRVEWYANASGMPENVIGTETGWKTVVYGVYDVNGTAYDGGEGGWFQYGYLCLSNSTGYEGDLNDYASGSYPGDSQIVPVIFGVTPSVNVSPPTGPWVHSGTLGWLNWWAWNNEWDGLDTGVTSDVLTDREAKLTKLVSYLDIDQDGNKGAAEKNDGDSVTASDEVNIPFEWWPTEELYWQLTYKFTPPVFKKIPPSTCCMFGTSEVKEGYDFMVLPSPGATPDAAGAAWLNARFTSMLVTFDVEAYNMIATVGYTNPATKMLPYLMLRLEPIPTATEDYPTRKTHYLTIDGRALPQMEWEDIEWEHCLTPWLDKHYMVVTVAGVHPNLATYYFNDFTPITRAVGGDYQWDIVVLPFTGPIDIGPYVGTELGKGVIALAKDHFNNIALIVYGLDAQDTYWTAFWATHDWPFIAYFWGDVQAALITLNYTETGHDWGIPNMGIPTAHPSYEGIYYTWLPEALATEWWSIPPLGEELD